MVSSFHFRCTFVGSSSEIGYINTVKNKVKKKDKVAAS